MIIAGSKKLKKVNFENEEELEKVVKDFYENLFGEYSIYLPQRYVITAGGFGSVPDAFVLNFKERSWYIVEIELARHGVWSHIVQQATKHLVAVRNSEIRRKLIDMFMREVKESNDLKRKFAELGIDEIGIREVIEDIIERPVILAIPIDFIPADLKDWASVLKNEVRLIEIEKYVDEKGQEVLYKFPDYLPSPPAEEETALPKPPISREEFIAQCEEPGKILFNELERIAAEKKHGDELVPRTSSYSYRIRVNSREISLLTVYPDSVYIMKYNLTPEKGFKPEAIQMFEEKIKKIEELSNRYDIMKQPGFGTRSTHITIDDIKTFIEAFRELLDSL